jgi:hypothetical protein
MDLKYCVCGIAVAAIALAVPAPAAAQWTDDDALTEHEWIASGQVGSVFGASAEDASAGATATITYLRDGMVGAEFLAGFSPDLDLALAPTDNSAAGNFMVNGVAALPFGVDGRWQPFVSGGIGAMTISSELMDGSNNLFEVDDTQLGGNVGFGLMAFGDQWGLRTDVRYFTGFENEADGDPIDVLEPSDFLGDVDYWGANVGVAYRW